MRRHRIIKEITSCVKETDILIFSNGSLGKEGYLNDREGNFYIDSKGLVMSFGLGIAMNTNRRVFVFCNDDEFLRELGAAAQVGASKCNNFYCILFNYGVYQDAGGSPTIFRSLYSPRGFLFNLGIPTSEYTHFFKNKVSLKTFPNILNTLKGPAMIFITPDVGVKKDMEINVISEDSLKERMTNFLVKKD